MNHLITGWVMTVGVHTISQVILTGGLHESEQFATIYRFLQKAKWAPDQVAFEVFRMILDTKMPDATEFELVLDDTLNNHVGKKIFGAGIQHDGDAPKTGKPIGYGVCFVIIGVVVHLPGISTRVFCLPYAARLWYPEKAKVKPLGEHRNTSKFDTKRFTRHNYSLKKAKL
ncbi:MAG: transposase [Syntrophaceae bacterium]|nr:transposase [Syntrophaceae bacterium]